MRSFIFGAMNYLSLFIFGNAFMYQKRRPVVDTVYTDSIISC